MAVALRELLARFSVSFDDKELKKGDKAVDGLADKLASLGKLLVAGAVVQGVTSFVTELANQANALKDHAASLGISTDQLQQWQYAASLSGSDAETLTASLGKLQKAVALSADGTGPAADAFRSLKVSLKDAHGATRNVSDIFGDAAAALSKIENPTERAGAAVALFGNSASKMNEFLGQGAEGLAKLRAEATALGGGISPETAENAAAMNDSITRLNFAWLSLKSRLGGIILPLVERFMTQVTTVTARVTKWTDKIGVLGKNSNVAAAAAVVLGGAFLAAGIKAIAPWLPMIALFGGLILLVDELITLWQGGDTLIGRAIDSIFGEGSAQKAVAWVKEVVESVRYFFADTTRGWAEFVAGVKLIWFDLLEYIKGSWAGLALVTLIQTSIDGSLAAMKLFAGSVTAQWDAIIAGAEKVGKVFDVITDKVPGLRKLMGAIAENNLSVLAGPVGAAVQTARVAAPFMGRSRDDQAAIQAQRQAIIDSASVRTATAVAPSSATMTDNSVININIPPGSPQALPQQIAGAVKQAQGPSKKAQLNALVKTAG
ncbi:MAG TPA: hypothetical protein VM493_07790 [Vicinamibacterales bacterium]|nr:hypothetical protein [Vicinamibacterales bacterium]